MNRSTIRTCVSLCLLQLASLPGNAGAQSWTQWRGAGRDGHAPAELAAPASWPESASRRWQVEVGEGHAGAVTDGTRAYVFSRQGGEEVVTALELETGRRHWRAAYAAPYEVYPGAAEFGRGPRSTPALVGGSVCTLGVGGMLSCFDVATGRLLWQKDFEGRFPSPKPPFGTSMSPLAAGDLLIAHVGGHDGGALLALDPRTGDETWAHAGEGPGYASPILVEIAGVAQVVTQAHRRILGVELATGELLWSLPFLTPCNQNIVTPVFDGERLIFSSVGHGLFAVEVSSGDEGFSARRVWEIPDLALYMSSPVVVAMPGAAADRGSRRLIGMSHRRRGQYFALDSATGELVSTSAGRQAENASLIAWQHNVLALDERGGLVVLPTAGSDLEPVARYTLSDTSTWAHPTPTRAGLLVKDKARLSLWSFAPAPGPRGSPRQ